MIFSKRQGVALHGRTGLRFDPMMQNRVLITKSEPSATESLSLWREAGFMPTAYPLLIIYPCEDPRPLAGKGMGPEPHHILLFTSANGVRAFCQTTSQRHWPVITVGDQTALTARACGFRSVSSAKGGWEDMVDYMTQTYPQSQSIAQKEPHDGPQGGSQDGFMDGAEFFHIRGENVRGDLVSALHERGLKAQDHIYYSAKINPHLNIDEFRQNDIITFYSLRAATHFKTLNFDCRHHVSMSMSKAINAALEGCGFKTRLIAKRPNEADMIEALRSGLEKLT